MSTVDRAAVLDPEIDVLDPATYVDGPPYATFARWRGQAPVQWRSERDGPGYWFLTRHHDVLAVSRDWATFSSERCGSMLYEMGEADLAVHRQLLVGMDPPRHTRARLLVNRAFTPAAMRALRDDIEREAAALVAAAVDGGRCDVVHDLAARLPVAVMSTVLGIPEADREHVVGLVGAMMQIPGLGADAGSFNDALAAVCEYGRGLFAERRRHPRDDVPGRLVDAEIDGDRLGDDELEHFLVLLVTAGTDTAAHGIAHAVLALAEHPDAFARLRADVDLVPTAVEEVLRWGTPTMAFRRTASVDARIGDAVVPAGDKVVMSYVAANRDPAVFAGPDRFAMDRTPNPHLAFGAPGAHICLGAGLARLELAAVLRALRTVPPPRLDGPVVRIPSNMVAGLQCLPIAWCA